MKRVSLWVSVSVLLFSMVSGAQSLKSAVANVPFAFVAAKKQFPAGTYVVTSVSNRLTLRSADGGAVVTLGASPLQSLDTAETSKFVFYDIDGRHFLARVLFAGDDQGAELIHPGTEREVARRYVEARSIRASIGHSADQGK